MIFGLIAPQAHAQTLSPLTEDQDGDGDPLNEEYSLRADCITDQDMVQRLANLGAEFERTLSEDDCDFAMHYLSGQCEEQTAKGVNVTIVCDTFLSNYLKSRDLLTKDFPIDTERFNTVLNEFDRKTALEEQEIATEEANIPSWTKELQD
jgi:hypothetical protein